MSAIRLPYRGFIFDLDGTVYLGESLLPGAKAAIAALRDHDLLSGLDLIEVTTQMGLELRNPGGPHVTIMVSSSWPVKP